MNDYHWQRSAIAEKEVAEMLKNPYTKGQAIEQVIRLFEQDMVLTPEDNAIWNNHTLNKHQRILAIHNLRGKKEREEYEKQ